MTALGLVALLVVSKRAARRRWAAVDGTVRGLGFARSSATIFGADHHWVGTWEGRPTIIGYYPGTPRAVGYAGVMLMMDVGVLPGGTWGADLGVQPPQPKGRGPGREQLEAVLRPEFVASARALPAPLLMPGAGLLEGNTLRAVAKAGWTGGWRGLHLRVVLPTRSRSEQIAATLGRMHTAASQLAGAE